MSLIVPEVSRIVEKVNAEDRKISIPDYFKSFKPLRKLMLFPSIAYISQGDIRFQGLTDNDEMSFEINSNKWGVER